MDDLSNARQIAEQLQSSRTLGIVASQPRTATISVYEATNGFVITVHSNHNGMKQYIAHPTFLPDLLNQIAEEVAVKMRDGKE